MTTPLSLVKNLHRPLSFSELDLNFTLLKDGIDSINVQQWITNTTRNLEYSDTIVISGDLVLDTSILTLTTSESNIIAGPLVFNQCSQVFIGGNLVLNNSNVINQGLLRVAGGIILLGTSSITGKGLIM